VKQTEVVSVSLRMDECVARMHSGDDDVDDAWTSMGWTFGVGGSR
jgi:hypothetical protein